TSSVPSTLTLLVGCSAASASVAALVGSAIWAWFWSGWRVPFVTVRSSEFHAQNVVPSETSVRSPVGLGIWTRPLPSPPAQIWAERVVELHGAVERAGLGFQHRRHEVLRRDGLQRGLRPRTAGEGEQPQPDD